MSTRRHRLSAGRLARQRRRERDRLVTSALPAVQHIIDRVYLRTPLQVDKDEIRSVAHLAIVELADRYDPARGVPWIAYVRRYLPGRLVDWQRQQDMMGRAARRKVTRGEIAGVFQVQLDTCAIEGHDDWESERSSAESATTHDTLRALTCQSDYERIYDTDEQVIAVMGAMVKLPRLERRLMLLHGICGVSLHRIAKGYGDRSRVSLGAVYRQTLERLRRELV